MDKFAASFEAELKKLGFSLPPHMANPKYLIGSILAGLAISDILKGSSIEHAVTPEVIAGKGKSQVVSKEWVQKLLAKKPLETPTKVVTTSRDVKEMLKDPKFNVLTRPMLRNIAEKIIEEGENAAVVRGEKKDYVLVPEKANARVVEHEIGHLRDFASGEYTDPGFLKRLLGMLWKPTYEGDVMARERRAWKYAKPTPIAEKAVKTYEKGFYKGRTMALAPIALRLLLGGIRSASSGVR
jgi:hypothetical protein